jgi:hypothetical protein
MTKIAGSGSRIRIRIRIRIPLVRGMDPRIRIHPKMSWIRNTAFAKLRSGAWPIVSYRVADPLNFGMDPDLDLRIHTSD